jgi:hypothetical protein
MCDAEIGNQHALKYKSNVVWMMISFSASDKPLIPWHLSQIVLGGRLDPNCRGKDIYLK